MTRKKRSYVEGGRKKLLVELSVADYNSLAEMCEMFRLTKCIIVERMLRALYNAVRSGWTLDEIEAAVMELEPKVPGDVALE